MYHGIPLNWDLLVFFFGAAAWAVRGIVKGVRQINQRASGRVPAAAAQAAPTAEQAAPAAPQASQALPARAAPPAPVRERPRQRAGQPPAGGPAVPLSATRRDFERQEQELIAAEPSPLDAPLRPLSAPLSASSPQGLFSGADDLIRAVILQEILGPPLSRRSPVPAAPPPPLP